MKKMTKQEYEKYIEEENKKETEEYKEWINDGLNKHTVLLLRDDPII